MVILDIADMAHPKMVARWDSHPPYFGFTHTVVPFFDRNLLIVSDECTRTEGTDWPKLVGIVDGRTETNPVPISTCPLPPLENFMRRGARYGAHNLYENLPKPNAWKSERIVLATFFNGGLRPRDTSNPFPPAGVGDFVPEPPAGGASGALPLHAQFLRPAPTCG